MSALSASLIEESRRRRQFGELVRAGRPAQHADDWIERGVDERIHGRDPCLSIRRRCVVAGFVTDRFPRIVAPTVILSDRQTGS